MKRENINVCLLLPGKKIRKEFLLAYTRSENMPVNRYRRFVWYLAFPKNRASARDRMFIYIKASRNIIELIVARLATIAKGAARRQERVRIYFNGSTLLHGPNETHLQKLLSQRSSFRNRTATEQPAGVRRTQPTSLPSSGSRLIAILAWPIRFLAGSPVGGAD